MTAVEQPRQSNIAASAAILLLAGWFAAPALAAPERDALCDELTEATLEIRTETMSTTVDAVADEHLLRPRVAATARKVFTDNDSQVSQDDTVDESAEEDETEAPRLRSLSDNELVPFRRQMYRRDI